MIERRHLILAGFSAFAVSAVIAGYFFYSSPDRLARSSAGKESKRAGEESKKKLRSSEMPPPYFLVEPDAKSPSSQQTYSQEQILEEWKKMSGNADELDKALDRLSLDDLESLASALAALAPNDQRNLVLAAAIKKLGITQPSLALQIAGDIAQPELKASMAESVVGQWMFRDGRAAAAWTLDHASSYMNGERCGQLYINAFNQWSQQNPATAMEVMTKDNSDPQFTILWCIAMSRWVEKDFAASLKWTMSQPAGPAREVALIEIVCQITSQNPQEGVRFFQSLPLADQTPTVLNNLVSTWAARDHEAASKWSSMVADADKHSAAVTGAIQGLSSVDIDSAAAQVSAMPSGKEKAMSMLMLTIRWSQQDISKAGRWLAEQSPGTERDEAVRAAWPQLLADNPAQATHLADQVTDTQRRQTLLTQSLPAWFSRDPAAATAWLNQIPNLTPEERKQLLNSN